MEFDFRFTGRPIFRAKSVQELLLKNKLGKIKFHHSEWARYSKEGKSLTKQMLRKDPEVRIKLQDIRSSQWMIAHDDQLLAPKCNKIMMRHQSIDTGKRGKRLTRFFTKFNEDGTEFEIESSKLSSNKEKRETNDKFLIYEEGKIHTNPANYSFRPRFILDDPQVKVALDFEKTNKNLSGIPTLFQNYTVPSIFSIF